MDGNNPVLLTAYGGFSLELNLVIRDIMQLFINAGGVVVEPGIQGRRRIWRAMASGWNVG